MQTAAMIMRPSVIVALLAAIVLAGCAAQEVAAPKPVVRVVERVRVVEKPGPTIIKTRTCTTTRIVREESVCKTKPTCDQITCAEAQHRYKFCDQRQLRRGGDDEACKVQCRDERRRNIASTFDPATLAIVSESESCSDPA